MVCFAADVCISAAECKMGGEIYPTFSQLEGEKAIAKAQSSLLEFRNNKLSISVGPGRHQRRNETSAVFHS